MKRWIWVALCLLMTVGIASGETKDELWKKIRIAANGWKQYKPSAQAIQRVKDCLMKSTSPEIITGWETILDPQTVAKAAAEKRAIHATVADGKMSDWKPPQAAADGCYRRYAGFKRTEGFQSERCGKRPDRFRF